MYTNIMFDLDGTVTDSGRAILGSVEYALSRLGITNQPIEKLKTFIGPSLFGSFAHKGACAFVWTDGGFFIPFSQSDDQASNRRCFSRLSLAGPFNGF